MRFSKLQRAVAKSLVPVICPPEAEPLADAIVDHLELTLGASPFLVGRAFAAGLVAYDLAAVPRFFQRAHRLRGERAEKYFAMWEHGQFGRAVNQLISFGCYEQPEMMDAIGYRVGPWMEEVTKKRLAVFAGDVRAQQTQILAPDPLRPRAKKEVA